MSDVTPAGRAPTPRAMHARPAHGGEGADALATVTTTQDGDR